MPNMLEPRYDQWYAHLDKGGMFKVVAIDPCDGSIEVQNFEGIASLTERARYSRLIAELKALAAGSAR